MSDPQGYTILFFICLTSVALLRAILKKTRPTSPRRLPPSPPALPIIGHLHLLGPIPHQSFHKLSTRYGPLIHLSLGSTPCIVASSPEVAKEFLKTHESFFSNRPKSAAADYLTYGSQDFTFAAYGPYWKFMKKVCMSELLGGRTLQLLLPVKRDEVELFVDSLFRKAKAGEAIDVGAELTRVTNNVISRMVMRKRCSEDEDEAREVRELVKETTVLLGKFNVSDFIWFCKNLDVHGLGKRMRDVHHRLDEMLERIIKEHEGARKKNCDTVKDLLDILLDIKENDNSEKKLSKENIKGFVLNALVGGTDTSSLTTEWALAELINHPNIMEKAKKEIDAVVGKNRLVEESDIAKLPYLQAIVKETLRLHPSGPVIGRESSEDCTIMGYHIPAKTRLFVNVWAIGRDPNHWDKPLEFRPERFFVEGSEKGLLDVRGQHFHLLPFGTGRRGCPGISLALQVVQTTLAAMIQCFDWKIINGDGKKGLVDMEEKPGFTLLRAHPLVCVPVARLSPFPSV